jgi:hypothetical protein
MDVDTLDAIEHLLEIANREHPRTECVSGPSGWGAVPEYCPLHMAVDRAKRRTDLYRDLLTRMKYLPVEER